jgi:hypothetical protein
MAGRCRKAAAAFADGRGHAKKPTTAAASAVVAEEVEWEIPHATGSFSRNVLRKSGIFSTRAAFCTQHPTIGVSMPCRPLPLCKPVPPGATRCHPCQIHSEFLCNTRLPGSAHLPQHLRRRPPTYQGSWPSTPPSDIGPQLQLHRAAVRLLWPLSQDIGRHQPSASRPSGRRPSRLSWLTWLSGPSRAG